MQVPNTIYYGTGVLVYIDGVLLTHVFLYTFSSLSDADAAHFHISATEKADFIEEVTTEISVYLGMLYHLIEVFKGHDEFADELSEICSYCNLFPSEKDIVSLDPPLPVYLFSVVAGLRDKSAKGYPIKKVSYSPFMGIFICSPVPRSFSLSCGKQSSPAVVAFENLRGQRHLPEN